MSWTPAALSPDLPTATAIPARCGEIEVALWRSGTGRLAAWRDRCPHRGMRLSHGFVRGEMLSCIYHGWRYDREGQCRKIPAHPQVEPPETLRTAALAVTEADGVIWLAEEAPAEAPPALPGLAPLRSVTVDAAPSRVAAVLGAAETGAPVALAEAGVTVLLQPLSEARTTLHALARAGIDRKVASRALESLRRGIEAREAA